MECRVFNNILQNQIYIFLLLLAGCFVQSSLVFFSNSMETSRTMKIRDIVVEI